MSYNNTSYNQNTSNAIQNALASIQNASANSILAAPIYNTGNTSLPFTDTSYKISPTFRMEMFKSENGGFVMHLITRDVNTHAEKIKIFILKEIEELGRDIQNILVMEALKS